MSVRFSEPGLPEAIDPNEVWEIETVVDPRTGCHSAQCPLCERAVDGQTGPGCVEALCAHMNEWHFRPPKGNA